MVKLTDEVGELVQSQMPDDVGYVLIILTRTPGLVNVTTNIQNREQTIEVLRDYVRAYDQGVMSEPVELPPARRKN